MVVFILSIAILLVAVFLGYQMQEDPGYVHIVVNKVSVETSFWVALIVIILGFIIFYFLLRFVDKTVHLRGQVKDWKDERKLRKLQQMTNNGLYELAEGNWKTAEQSLVNAGDKGENPLINYLAAARAAQAQSAYDRRDSYLRKALLTTQGAEVAVGLTQAELQLQSDQLAQAAITLKHLNAIAPKHAYVMQLLAQVYEQQQDLEGLKKLMPTLMKAKALPESALAQLEKRLAVADLKLAAKENKAGALMKAWHYLPKKLRYSPDVVVIYCQLLSLQNEHAALISTIESALKKEWDARLVDIYGTVVGNKISKQISWGEYWLKQRPRDPHVLLCLGRLCKADKLWGKAKEYLQQAANLMPSRTVYHELGEVLTELEEKEAATECFKKGLIL
ncbi:MAG: hypothetical protein A3F17_04350 [Gammaproteobacteria bacterium RIFCSPHIGHO2_12_FULL_41_15]|nr:MAG: hypothetical protein A3F17_04350 [Gammaproteobacteria bacterium RIFCSPHIGHO2_12_FULL_41_15]